LPRGHISIHNHFIKVNIGFHIFIIIIEFHKNSGILYAVSESASKSNKAENFFIEGMAGGQR
jgi:hypothetical protein